MIVCPGGGFFQLTFGAEGVDAAKYLNSIGVAAFVLKYRLPRLTNSVYTMESPHQDGLRAMRLVRSRASEWGIDPNRLGMVGFRRAASHLDDRFRRHGRHHQRARPD